jgi:hypothetical protein
MGGGMTGMYDLLKKCYSQLLCVGLGWEGFLGGDLVVSGW